MGTSNKLEKIMKKLLTRKKDKDQLAYFEKLYGKFDKNDYEIFKIGNLPSESGYYHGEIIKWAADIIPGSILFVGENKITAAILKDKLNANEVYTTGLLEADYIWNFEENIPHALERKFDLIVSQAIFEHLLNPYKHLDDLSKLLNINGCIIIHTVMPGFKYHRYPIDAVRFFPDWFEEVAKRLKMQIERKRIKGTHIFYMYKKS